MENLSFNNDHSSPVLIDVDGRPQVVALMASEVIGFDPENGQLLWWHPHETQYGLAISTPIWLPGNLLFVSSRGFVPGNCAPRSSEIYRKTFETNSFGSLCGAL